MGWTNQGFKQAGRLRCPHQAEPVLSLTMAANSRDGRANARRLSFAAAALGGAIVIVLAIRRVDGLPYTLSWTAALRGIWPTLPVTVPAAIRVWGFWGWSAAVVAGLLLKADPELGLCDSALGGATGIWVCAFLLGNLLGPIGLFRAPLAWALPAVGTMWLLRYPPAIRIRPPAVGQWFALLSIAMLAASILPLQLGSPMVPYLDALSWPASAERIVSFHVYQPFNNDPYGFWAPFSQEPALEMFYAMLALGSRTRLAGLPWYADGRWASSPADWALFEVLDREKSAGRITADTHILHVADGPKDFVRLAVFTGINDDPIEYSFDPNDPFFWGGRIGGVKEMVSRLADKPPYILFQTPAPAGMNLPPGGYDEIFHNGDLRLFRRQNPGDDSRPG